MTGTRQWDSKDGILKGTSLSMSRKVDASQCHSSIGFSWGDLPQGSVLVDIGGGIGATSITVAETHPHLRVVVEDRAQVVSTAISVCHLCTHYVSLYTFITDYHDAQAWGPQYAHLFESGRMSFRSRDFFEPWDPLTLPHLGLITSPSVFLVRLVLHNWPDDDARK